MPIDLDQHFDHFLDALRREQVSFLDSMRSLCMPLGPSSGALAAAASSQARLTQQFLDAQRSLLRRTAEFDTAAHDIERSAAEDARQMVIGAANYALDCGVPAEVLDALRWTVLDAARSGDGATDTDAAEFARRHQHELSQLLDRWWAETQDRGSALVERANSFAGLVRGRADVRVAAILEAVARHSAPHSTEAPTDSSSFMPTDVLAALDTADAGDLGALLDSLLVSLGASDDAPPPTAARAEWTAPDLSAEITDILDALIDPKPVSESGTADPALVQTSIEVPDGALIRLGQRATEPPQSVIAPMVAAPASPHSFDDDEPAGPLAVFTRVVLPMLLAVGAAVTLLAWMG